MKKSKKKSWIDFVELVSVDTPMSKIYETVNKIEGKNSRKIHIIRENGSVFSTIPDIANALASSFCKISGNDNYCREFIHHKEIEEIIPLSFETPNIEFYSSDFTIEELNWNLSRTSNTAPGPDGVHYEMLKHLPIHAKQSLVQIFNKFWKETFFPIEWSKSHIIIYLYPNQAKTTVTPKIIDPLP